jgi:hypothetical protein
MAKVNGFNFKGNNYYYNGYYEAARKVFNQLYESGERSRAVIKEAALKEMRNYGECKGWSACVITYNIKYYGLKSLMYWFEKYDNKLEA